MERYVKGPDGDLLALDAQDIVPQHLRKGNAPGLYPDEAEPLGSAVVLKDLVGHSDQAALERLGIHNIGFKFQNENRLSVFLQQKMVLPFGKTTEKFQLFRKSGFFDLAGLSVPSLKIILSFSILAHCFSDCNNFFRILSKKFRPRRAPLPKRRPHREQGQNRSRTPP